VNSIYIQSNKLIQPEKSRKQEESSWKSEKHHKWQNSGKTVVQNIIQQLDCLKTLYFHSTSIYLLIIQGRKLRKTKGTKEKQ
jgi:hypothetical protein